MESDLFGDLRRGASSMAKMLRTHRSRVTNIASHILKQSMMDFDGKPIGASFESILEKVSGAVRDFSVYLVAQRTLDILAADNKRMARWKRGGQKGAPPQFRETGIDAETARKALRVLNNKYPEFAVAARELYEYQDHLLQRLVDAGVLREQSAKAPQVITHERFLEGCDVPLREFLNTMSALGDRLGPMVFQFPYYARRSGVEFADFLERVQGFLPSLPREGFAFALEVRNKTWLRAPLLEALAEHGIALVLIDHPWMHRPRDLFRIRGFLTGNFLYIRWLGDRCEIEKQTKTWDRTLVDRTERLTEWSAPVADLLEKGVPVYGYFNNHYSGYAPADVRKFDDLVRRGNG